MRVDEVKRISAVALHVNAYVINAVGISVKNVFNELRAGSRGFGKRFAVFQINIIGYSYGFFRFESDINVIYRADGFNLHIPTIDFSVCRAAEFSRIEIQISLLPSVVVISKHCA